MRNFFGDGIHDKLFPNEIKKFTQEEKFSIDRFITAFFKYDTESDLQESRADSFNDRVDKITEVITKKFIFKGVLFNLYFCKYFSNNVNDDHTYPRTLEYDGHYDTDSRYQDRLLKDFAEEGSITGILVKGEAYPNNKYTSLDFVMKSKYDDTTRVSQAAYLGIRTRYQGDKLTTDSKHKMETYHFNIILSAILKNTNK